VNHSLSGAATARNLLVPSNRDDLGTCRQTTIRRKKEQIQNRRVECVIIVQMSFDRAGMRIINEKTTEDVEPA
jgi:hypothetical protein